MRSGTACTWPLWGRIWMIPSEENEKRPDNATFISFAPFDDPKISVSVMIPHGYTSGNASELGRFIYNYYYGFLTYEEILSGEAIDEGGNEINE